MNEPGARRVIDKGVSRVQPSGACNEGMLHLELGEVIDDARSLVEALLRQRGQELQVDVAEGLGLQGDATRLAQVGS